MFFSCVYTIQPFVQPVVQPVGHRLYRVDCTRRTGYFEQPQSTWICAGRSCANDLCKFSCGVNQVEPLAVYFIISRGDKLPPGGCDDAAPFTLRCSDVRTQNSRNRSHETAHTVNFRFGGRRTGLMRIQLELHRYILRRPRRRLPRIELDRLD